MVLEVINTIIAQGGNIDMEPMKNFYVIGVTSHDFKHSTSAVNNVYMSAIISALVALVICIITGMFNRWQTYKQIITSERIRWVNDLRKDSAEFITIASKINLLMSNNKSSQQVDEKEIHETVIQARNKYLMIKLRMNPQGDKENNIIRQCEELISILIYGANNETCNNMMTETIENLTEDFQLFFKNEWERSKEEAENAGMGWLLANGWKISTIILAVLLILIIIPCLQI